MARTGGLTLTVSPASSSSSHPNGPSSGTHTSSHHFEFGGKISVNGNGNDDNAMNGNGNVNGNTPMISPALAAVRLGGKTAIKRGSGKLGDFQLASSTSISSLRSVLGTGGASISNGGVAGARRGSGQLMGPPLQSGGGIINNNNNNVNNANGASPTPGSTNTSQNNNTMRPPSQQHMRRFSAAATNNMSLSASPSLPTLSAESASRGSSGHHARSQSRSASPQPQPQQQQANENGNGMSNNNNNGMNGRALNHSTSVKQFGHAHSLSLSVHNGNLSNINNATSPQPSVSPNGPQNRLLAARAPPRESRRRTADRGEVKSLIGAAMGGHDRNSPTMAFAVSSAASSPSSRALNAAAAAGVTLSHTPPTGFGPGPTDTGSRDETGEHELRTSIKTNRIDRVRAAVDRSSININVKDPASGDTILHTACLKGNLEVVQILLRQRKEIDPNVVNNLGWTALMVACGGGALDVVKCLVQEAPSLNINIHRSNGWTAVMEAAKYGHHSIVQYLVSVGADTTPTRSGESLSEIRPMLPCTRAMIADAVRKGQQILNGQPLSARGKPEVKEFREVDTDDDDEDPMSARSMRKASEAKEQLRRRAERNLTDSKGATAQTSTLKMAEAAIIREDLLKEQLATANSLMARAQLDVERLRADAAEQQRSLNARVTDLEALLRTEREKNEALTREVALLRTPSSSSSSS